jgi:hypothetical protein
MIYEIATEDSAGFPAGECLSSPPLTFYNSITTYQVCFSATTRRKSKGGFPSSFFYTEGNYTAILFF